MKSARMVEKKVVIPNRLGIHARPAQLLAQEAGKYKARIVIEKDGVEVEARSILGLMMLVAAQGSVITVRAEGDDAQEAVEAIVRLVESGFGEE